MSKLLRYFQPGQSCFISSVTKGRQPILIKHADLLFAALQRTTMRYGFTVRAWVILPDHFHLILNVTNGCFADIIHGVKISFSAQYRKRTEQAGPVWQHRYWDHIIRSQEDMNRHIDYMHYNPIKHGMVDSTQDYRLSSFGEFCSSGLYEPDWRTKEFEFQDKEFGE